MKKMIFGENSCDVFFCIYIGWKVKWWPGGTFTTTFFDEEKKRLQRKKVFFGMYVG